MSEVWRPIPGYEESYAVSDLGRVRSLERIVRNGSGTRVVRGRILKSHLDNYGYPQLCLHKGCNAKTIKVHTLVLNTFVGPSDGAQCRHLNGVREDSRLTNITWGTPSENSDDRDRHGTTARNSRHGMAKLNEALVTEIRQRYKEGATRKKLAETFDITVTQVRNIVCRRHWRSI